MKRVINKLNACAIITRRYNVGDKAYFFDYFKQIDDSRLDIAWRYGVKKIQNREIVKDASNIEFEENKIAQERFQNFDKTNDKIFSHLQNDFNPKDFKLKDENIERRLRHLLANKYLQLEYSNLIELEEKRNLPRKEKVANFIANNFFKIIIIAVIGYFVAPPILDRLTPIDILANRIHEKSKYKFSGAICNDGWTSHSQGRGTCSWHDGVDYYFYKGEYSKSWEQCRQEAIKTSWLSP